ncbi:MAG TPA: translation initiation factor IF-2, partial [Pirellulaceae bacterium]|nr:translation initiation factor IF-2 [Pirellulaceae bacterium]
MAGDAAAVARAASGDANAAQGVAGQVVPTSGGASAVATTAVGAGAAGTAAKSAASGGGTASTGGAASRSGASGAGATSIVPPIIPSARPATPVGGASAGGGAASTVASTDSKSVTGAVEKPSAPGPSAPAAPSVVSAVAGPTEAAGAKTVPTGAVSTSMPSVGGGSGVGSTGGAARSGQPAGPAATSGSGPGGAATGGAAAGGSGGSAAGRHGLGTRMGSGTQDARDTRPGGPRQGNAPAAPPSSTIPPPAVSPMGQGRGAQPPSEPAPFTRSDYISPAGSPRGRILDVRTKRPAAEARTGGDAGTEAPKTPKKREPVININLPKMPEVKQPTPAPKAAEPKTQKPVIRLPTDAIRGARAGARPPLEHLTAKMEQQRKPRGPGERGPGDGGRPQPPLPTDSSAGKGGPPKGKKKHGVDEIAEGPEAERGELAGMASSRADRQKARKVRQQERAVIAPEEDDDSASARRARRLVRRAGGGSTAAPRKGKVEVQVPCALRTFCELTGVSTGQVLKTLMQLGMPVNINASLAQDACELIAAELGLDISVEQQQSPEEELLKKIKTQVDDPSALEQRPPVVTFLGHVDHGKTSLLDRIIGIDVVSGEAGGITQHIRAYEIAKNGRKIAFVDTPGHEAFTEMRARGANVTDIAVLVVAADDGVMPQTEEAINHAKAAGVPIVVALNKMDLPGANADRVLQQLAAQGLMPSEWSGDVEVVRCSALTGKGIDDLLETLLVTADLHEYKANPTRPALGVCLEAEQEPGRGVIAKVMVKNGTLSVGDIVVCGAAHGRVKAMFDTLHKDRRLKDAGPSTPVNLTGLDAPPQAGEAFYVLPDIALARALAARRESQLRENAMAASSRVSFQHFQQML